MATSDTGGRLYTIMQFPHEAMATLSGPDGTIVRFSYTFAHKLVSVLHEGRAQMEPSRDLDEFISAVAAIEQSLREACPLPTESQEEILLARHHAHGRGYWSSWMPEANPFTSPAPESTPDPLR